MARADVVERERLFEGLVKQFIVSGAKSLVNLSSRAKKALLNGIEARNVTDLSFALSAWREVEAQARKRVQIALLAWLTGPTKLLHLQKRTRQPEERASSKTTKSNFVVVCFFLNIAKRLI